LSTYLWFLEQAINLCHDSTEKFRLSGEVKGSRMYTDIKLDPPRS
jgi:hypothetical protein